MVGNRVATFAFATALAGALGACGAAAGGLPDADPRNGAASVEIENNNWHDMRVYAVLNGMRTRLGTVTSMTRKSLNIPRAIISAGLGELRLFADPIGRPGGYMSAPLQVRSGERVEWRLENHLPLSSLSVLR